MVRVGNVRAAICFYNAIDFTQLYFSLEVHTRTQAQNYLYAVGDIFQNQNENVESVHREK